MHALMELGYTSTLKGDLYKKLFARPKNEDPGGIACKEIDVNLIMSEAEKYGLILTGGSDFHGMYEGKPNLLGSCYTPEEWLQQLYERKESQKHDYETKAN